MNIIKYVIKWYNRKFKGVVYAEDSLPEDPLQLPPEFEHDEKWFDRQRDFFKGE